MYGKKHVSDAPTIQFLAKIHPREMKGCVQRSEYMKYLWQLELQES